VKTETAQPPLFGIGIRKVTPADIYAWRGPEVEITRSSPRIPAERKWYAVTGRVMVVYVEDDGDLHLIMQNTDGRRGPNRRRTSGGPPVVQTSRGGVLVDKRTIQASSARQRYNAREATSNRDRSR